MPPLVSVVIPHYNGKQWVKETIESVEEQTYDNIELVLVDDCSTDGSFAYLHGLDIDIDTTIVQNEENMGIAETRNRGVREADGKYIVILDQDDLNHPERIERQAAFMEENPDTGVSLVNLDHIDADGNVVYSKKYTRDLQSMSFPEIAELIYTSYWRPESPAIPLTTEMIRKDVFDEVGYYDTSLFGDNDRDLFVRIAKKYDVAVVKDTLFSKRTHGNNASSQDEPMIRDHITLTEKMLGLHPPLHKHYYKRKSFLDMDLGLANLKNGKYGEGVRNIVRGFVTAPLYATRIALEYVFLRPEKNM